MVAHLTLPPGAPRLAGRLGAVSSAPRPQQGRGPPRAPAVPPGSSRFTPHLSAKPQFRRQLNNEFNWVILTSRLVLLNPLQASPSYILLRPPGLFLDGFARGLEAARTCGEASGSRGARGRQAGPGRARSAEPRRALRPRLLTAAAGLQPSARSYSASAPSGSLLSALTPPAPVR